jgi:hypothetical protein
MDPILKLERQGRSENRFFGSREFDNHGLTNAGRPASGQRQQRRQADRPNVRKEPGQLFCASQFRFRKRCDQRAVHVSPKSSRTHTERRRNMHDENQRICNLEGVEGSQNKWLRNFRWYFAGSASQAATCFVSSEPAAPTVRRDRLSSSLATNLTLRRPRRARAARKCCIA